MKNRIVALSVTLFLSISFLSAQHLPGGTYHPNRDRTYDIVHYKADLNIDWKAKRVYGTATVTFHPLVSASSIDLDAYWLKVSSVKDVVTGKSLRFKSEDKTLSIDLGREVPWEDTLTVAIQYSATPTAGLYFIDPCPGTGNTPAIFTYGEGGIHANWLPIYNENNDKFSTEMICTVEKPYVAISNGKLLETKDNGNGTRTFHWSQKLPHSDYLIALFVGNYVAVPLRPAFGDIPMSVWVHPGQEDVAKTVFSRTPDMIEFYSRKFSFRYPWDKYDQISAYDYAIGAMENTGITGHNDRILRKPDQLEEFNPNFDEVEENWNAETIISHELAHHWFGDNLTCRNLANIWVNESFASYCMMLWDEHRVGEDYFHSQTDVALQSYLKYVREQHIIRPLEYRYFDSRNEIYNNETTYQKGGIVLNMLRWVLGDEAFFKALGYYMNKYKFSNVESIDFKTAIEESTGQNLQWFFEQWVWGGGHPVFEISSNYLADRKQVELSVNQVQPIVEGEGLFTLPLDIRIDANGSTQHHTVWVEHASDHFVFDVPGKPDMVSFDGRGSLVADIRFTKPAADLAYQVGHDELPGRLRALRQLAADHAGDPVTLETIRTTLAGNAHWSLKAETALQLGRIQSSQAEKLLLDQLRSNDYHIRKAAVIGLRSHFTTASRSALAKVIDNDKSDIVSATAIVSLATIDPGLSQSFLRKQFARTSWYDCVRIATLKAIEILASRPGANGASYVPMIRDYASQKYNYEMRQTALTTWAACSPTDGALINNLIETAATDILPVREKAIELIRTLKIARAVPTLQKIVKTNGDGDICKDAQDALDAIQSMSKP